MAVAFWPTTRLSTNMKCSSEAHGCIAEHKNGLEVYETLPKAETVKASLLAPPSATQTDKLYSQQSLADRTERAHCGSFVFNQMHGYIMQIGKLVTCVVVNVCGTKILC